MTAILLQPKFTHVMEFLYIGIIVFLFCLAISDIIVGVSNDAVNFLNSAVGSKTAKFRNLIIIASIGVFLGASLSNGMMDVARHGIFQPQYFTFAELICIMLAVMVTDVILLDAFNSRGLPTSTTVSLVFELLGGTVALAMIKNIQTDGALTFAQMINTDKALSVILGIFLSIAIAFVFGMVIQWIVRTIFTFNYKPRLKYLAGVFGGVATTAIVYFLLIKGLKDYQFLQTGKDSFKMIAEISDEIEKNNIEKELNKYLWTILQEKNLQFVKYSITFTSEILPDDKTGKKPLIVASTVKEDVIQETAI